MARQSSLSAPSSGWLARLSLGAGVVLLGAVCAFWGLQLLSPAPVAAPAGGPADSRALADTRLAQTAFGVQGGAVAAAPSNLVVTGIVAAGRLGSALISVDGKPARAYHVGEELSPGQKLVAVRNNVVVLETGAGRAELAGPPQASLAILNSAPPRDPAAPTGITPAAGGAAR